MSLLELIERLRLEGARTRQADGEEPAGGWAPIYDQDGNPVPMPPPTTPTDVAQDVAEEARRRYEEEEEGEG
jgi:hypothetical protein